MDPTALRLKTYDAHVKVDDDDEPGVYTSIVSVFGNVDSGGDRMKLGAFADTLAAEPHPPVVWSHQWTVPPIGETIEAAELAAGDDRLPPELHDLGGLWTRSRLFVAKDEDHPTARMVYAGMKAEHRPVRQFSFGYFVTAGAWVDEDGAEIYEIAGVDLIEHGPCLLGMNQATTLLQVASGLPDLGRLAHRTPPAKDAGDNPQPGPGDKPATIDPDRALALITKTRHEEAHR